MSKIALSRTGTRQLRGDQTPPLGGGADAAGPVGAGVRAGGVKLPRV
ncbi:hypothetical protein ACMA1D_24345 [Streptomyces sp. 796.1]